MIQIYLLYIIVSGKELFKRLSNLKNNVEENFHMD